MGLRKAVALRAAGFPVTLVDCSKPARRPRGSEFRKARVTAGSLPRLIRGAILVVSALDDHDLNRAVAAGCRKARVPVNVVDQPALCDFTMPAVAARGNLVVAISSSGLAPFLSATLRRELQPLVDQRAPLVSLVARLRRQGAGPRALRRVFGDRGFRSAVAGSDWKLAHRLASGLLSVDGGKPRRSG